MPSDYKYNNKEFIDDLGLNTLDYGFHLYDPLTARWNGVDALAEKFHSSGSYNYVLGNPVRFIDPDGRSTHTNAAGNVIAVFDDGDLGVYRHDIQPGTHVDGARAYIANKRTDTGTTSGGGERMGYSLQIFSFVNGEKLEENQIVPEGKIDFQSKWAQTQINHGLCQMQGKPLSYYALNAQNKHPLDLKAIAQKQFGTVYYGSLVYGEIYASARDAGNFLAGMVQQNSLVPNYIISVGFGSYNETAGITPTRKRLLETGLKSLDKFILGSVPTNNIDFEHYPYYGETFQTGKAIELGRSYAKQHSGYYINE